MILASAVRVSKRQQAQVVRALQAGMAVILLLGLWYGNGGVTTNAAIGLAATFLPALIRRNTRITMDVGLVLWLSVAMFLHAFGTLPLPGLDFLSAYAATTWWDHMTHALSSSLVAGVAYATARALDEHTEFITLPPAFLFVFLLVFVMAFGVIWELIEWYIGLAASLFGTGAVLTQYGLGDTVLDLFYNTLGGILVAVFGTAHLADLSGQLSAWLDTRSANR